MTLFWSAVVNVVVPLAIAGVVSWVVQMPEAPLSPRARQLIAWVVWLLAAIWIVIWLAGFLTNHSRAALAGV